MAAENKAIDVRRVVLTTRNNSVFTGLLHSVDRNAGKVVLKNVSSDGVKLFGLQHFYSSDIVDLQYLGDGLERCENQKQSQSKKKNFNFEKVPLAHLSYLKDVDTDELTMSNIFQDANNENVKDDCKDVEDCRQTEEYILLNKICDQFYDAIKHIMVQSIVAVNFDGVNLGRNGTLSLIEVATETKVFVFDMLKMGVDAFNQGLDALFASKAILKVMHDCRFVSDMMHHKYKISMTNIFDTQVANAFVYRLNHQGDWPRYVVGLPGCLVNHLNLSNDQVCFMRVSENNRKKDEAVWLQRPLTDKLLSAVCKNIKYLIQLYHVLMKKMLLEFRTGVYIYLNHVDNNGGEVEKCRANLHLLPHAFLDLQHYTSFYNLSESGDKSEVQYDNSGFRENCPNIKDKEITFNHDAIWHKSLKSDNRKTANQGQVPKEKSTNSKNIGQSQPKVEPAIEDSQNENLIIPDKTESDGPFSKSSVDVGCETLLPDAIGHKDLSNFKLKTGPNRLTRIGHENVECTSGSSSSSSLSESHSNYVSVSNSKELVNFSHLTETRLSKIGSQQLDSKVSTSSSQSTFASQSSSSLPKNYGKSNELPVCKSASENIRKSKLWKVVAKSEQCDENTQHLKTLSDLEQVSHSKDQRIKDYLNSPSLNQMFTREEQHGTPLTSPSWPKGLSPIVHSAGEDSFNSSDGDVSTPSRSQSDSFVCVSRANKSKLAGNSFEHQRQEDAIKKTSGIFLNRPPSLPQNLTPPIEWSEPHTKLKETISTEQESSNPLAMNHDGCDDLGCIPMQHSLNRKNTLPLGLSVLGIGDLFSEEENCQSSVSHEEFVKSRLAFKDEAAIKDGDIERLHQTESVQKIFKLASMTSSSDVKKKLLPSIKPPST